MNRDDIIRIYEKANGWSPEGWDKTVDELERFATLVAAAEREACAKVCDAYDVAEDVCSSDTAEGIALAIRARGQE